VGRHKIVKQISTSSIQVSEGKKCTRTPILRRPISYLYIIYACTHIICTIYTFRHIIITPQILTGVLCRLSQEEKDCLLENDVIV
jgi:TRAP-type C4-dicarboxylate transport system permease small subunit